MAKQTVPSGIQHLDQLTQGLRLGDNVVWQVGDWSQYVQFARPFAEQARRDGRTLVYLRFASHPPVLGSIPGMTMLSLDPGPGFDRFSGEVHRIIEERGREVFYVFDNLSALVAEWATDELLANFFQVTCPFLFELDTVAYFALTRGQHAYGAVARIRDTTQLLIDVYPVGGQLCVHPLKVWDRFAPHMFLPHVVKPEGWEPLWGSGEAAAADAARGSPLREASGSVAPWESVYRRLAQHVENRLAPTAETPVLRQELTRLLMGQHPEFNRLADAYLTPEDLLAVRGRMIGSGRIGGKAAGMLVARRIVAGEPGEFNFAEILEEHDSFYIGSDVFFTFLVQNDLFRWRWQLAKSGRPTHEEFEAIEQRFLEGRFPAEVMEQFRSVLEYYGQAPIIVRSSSLLEDSFKNAFAGKYRSEFCANQGSIEERLAAFLRAVKLVYASALNPDALAYRQRRGLEETDELMAILVQRVSGRPHGRYFFPPLAGVGFSRNLYAWTDRIDPRRGMLRLVFGLGTRAVNRVGGDYPRMIALSHPLLRPEVGEEIARYSQREVDLLNLEANEFQSRPASEVLAEQDFPGLHLYVSERRDGGVYDPVSRNVGAAPAHLVLTFNNLLKQTALAKAMAEALGTLERAYGQPVDTEFTASVDSRGKLKINLLQCRPLRLPGVVGAVEIPSNVPATRVLFRSGRTINGGRVSGIRWLLHISPRGYAEMDSLERKKALGRVVGRVNALPQVRQGRIMLMGPGRWGSSHIDLGVNVTYSDIDNTAVLVELAREEAGQVPEVSYGTHFFQDLVENQVIYLPVYPDDPGADFNQAFFRQAPNVLAKLIPGLAEFQRWVHVIDVPACAEGASVQVVADPQSQQAMCYLE